jgi:hypothetical protein
MHLSLITMNTLKQLLCYDCCRQFGSAMMPYSQYGADANAEKDL